MQKPEISLARMQEILRRGESVTYRGRLITDPKQLPSAAELASGDREAQAAVLRDLDRQQAEIDRQRRQVQNDMLRDGEKPGALDAQLANDPQEARRHPPRQQPADPDADLRTAHRVMSEMYGNSIPFAEFKAEYARRSARTKAEAESITDGPEPTKDGKDEAKAAVPEPDQIPKKDGEPQDAEHPHSEGKTAHQVVEESREGKGEAKDAKTPAQQEEKKRGK